MLSSFLKKIASKAGFTIIKTDFYEKYYYRKDDPQYRKTEDLDPLEQLFYKYIYDDFFFIQIGANNGQRYDPVHHLIVREKDKVSGIAIEPVQEYFDELKITYKDFPLIKLIRKVLRLLLLYLLNVMFR